MSYGASECREDGAKVILVIIQWHICAFAGFALDVASGSVRAKTYVARFALVRVGSASASLMLKTGGDPRCFGLIELPKFTDLCFEE